MLIKQVLLILRYKMCKAPWLLTEFLPQKVENKQAQKHTFIQIYVHIHTHIYIKSSHTEKVVHI